MKNIVWLDKKDNLRGNLPANSFNIKNKSKILDIYFIYKKYKEFYNFINVCIFVSGLFSNLLPLFTSPFLN